MFQDVFRSTVSTAELRSRLADRDLTIVDVRPIHAYNGWRPVEAPRGGHIPGAVVFPSAWLTSVDDAEVVRLLHSKDIVPSREVVLYGGSSDVSEVRSRLVDLGHTGVRTYDAGWAEWTADETLPVERLPNHERLVHSDWLWRVLDGDTPEAAPNGHFLLFHVNFGVPEEYEEDHLPGAFYLDTNRLENPVDWQRRTPEELEATLRALGIARDTTVVLYGRDTEGDANEKWPGRRAGQIAATRAALILRYAGVDDVRLLDGGYDAWVRAGNPVETTLREPTPITSFGVRIPARPEVIVDIDEAKQILSAPDSAALVSVRTWNEHIGQVSRLQLHRPGRPDLGRRLGQLRLGRVPHAALPQRGQHDARVSGDRGQLGGSRDHPRQVGRVLLRDRLASERDLVLRLSHGLAENRSLRRRLVRVEPRPDLELDRDGRAQGRAGRVGVTSQGRLLCQRAKSTSPDSITRVSWSPTSISRRPSRRI